MQWHFKVLVISNTIWLNSLFRAVNDITYLIIEVICLEILIGSTLEMSD